MKEENLLRDNLYEQYDYNKDDKLEKAIMRNCYIVFDNLSEDGEKNVYIISELEVNKDQILSFILFKDDIPVSTHSFSIENVYEFNELDKLILKSINS
ncbi:hypothetical protein CPT_Madawaska_142 [Staphylococcus phage Madawaska]|nr:hypothetical protein CPT_Madawaska_142 [Staphylococcus phage Madawaska]